MKQIISLIILTLYFNISLNAQCEDKGISTNPTNPQNNENPSARNNFFWFPFNGNTNSQIHYRLSGTNQDVNMNNPFWQPSSSTSLFEQYAQYGNSDFYPEDGWELIKSDFGKLADNSTLRQTLPGMIYFCLYNRYTGTMRFFGAIPNANEAFQVAKFRITLLTHRRGTPNISNNNKNLDATNLLSIQGNSIGTLDEETNENIIEVTTDFPGVLPAAYFFWFDIPVAYDPCICYNNTAVELNGILIKNSTVTLTGDLFGTLQTTTTPPGNIYSNLVLKRVVGLGTALATAAVTKGAVIQTGKFIDFISLITNNPNINASEKTQYEMLQKFLNSTNNLIRKDDKWVDAITNESMTDAQFVSMMSGINSFVSSGIDIATKGEGGSKSTTTVNGKIYLTGSIIQKEDITQKPYWAVPGSNWASTCEEEVSSMGNGTPEKKPEYPIYNEPLGTFAFIKKPKLKLNIKRAYEYSINQSTLDQNFNPNYWLCDGFKFEGYLMEDLQFTVNPKLNINPSKTKIKVMFYADCERETSKTWKWELMDENKIPSNIKSSWNPAAIKERNPINMISTIDNQSFMSIPVDINDFRELFFKGTVIVKDFNKFIEPIFHTSETDIASYMLPKFYLKFYIEFESNNVGKDGKKIKNTQIFTVPVEYDGFDDDFPYIKADLNTNDHIDINTPGGIIYNSSKTVYAKTIRISTNLKTSNGAKVRIFATEEIIIDPNVEIDPNIELIISKNPFQQLHPQNLKDNLYVKDFCENKISGLQYKANNWASSVPPAFSIDDNLDNNNDFINKLISTISPNPTTANFTVSIFNNNEQDYSIALMDVTGKVLFNISYNGSQTSQFIETNGLAAGIYFVKITCGNTQKTEKLIIGSGY
ncbi:MAG: T9SS type A sorting domain-containing protein [Bacteroidota bacterium]|nr:T9SS type A sorting domain-containing protein [Bacteroidota bacterium]